MKKLLTLFDGSCFNAPCLVRGTYGEARFRTTKKPAKVSPKIFSTFTNSRRALMLIYIPAKGGVFVSPVVLT